MPLIRIDVIEGRSRDELKTLCDEVHSAMVEAFGVPPRDRYQLVHQHPSNEMHIEDTGLGFTRSLNVVVISVVSRPRTREAKQAFYRLLSEKLRVNCGIADEDTVISIVTNQDDDWSFGQGRAQFLTGELPSGNSSR
jgi:phenylpyruvate tautomerase PptA (4-oxalocrotonate tautomerase family)